MTQQIENRLSEYFPANQVSIQQFGSEVLTQNCVGLSEYLCTPKANIDASAMIVKFAPDFILLKRTEPQKVFFLMLNI